MGDKTPDTESSGIERRDVLKGLGFGAVGLAGAGAANSATAQQGQTPESGNLSIDYIKVVPEGEEVEVDTGDDTYVDRPWATADLVFGIDFRGGTQGDGQGNKTIFDGPVPIGYQFTIVEQQSRQPVTESFEEGRCRCFAGTVNVNPTGGATGRETFSLSGLGPDQPDQPANQYIAALTVSDYREGLDPVLAGYQFSVGDQPPNGNGGGGNQTTATTQDGGDAGAAGDGDGGDAGGAADGTTTTTTTTQDGNGGGGNGDGGNGGNGTNGATDPLI